MGYGLYNKVKMTYFCYDQSGRKSETHDIDQADVFERKKAENLLANCIAPMDQYKWEIVYIAGSVNVNTCDTENIRESIESSEIMTELSSIMKAVERLNEHIKHLNERYSVVERQQQDVLHYIENYDLNACEGYKAYKLLKQIRIERRKIKNEIKKAKLIDLGDLTKIEYGISLKKMAEYDTRTNYTPRVMKDLFSEETPRRANITFEERNCG